MLLDTLHPFTAALKVASGRTVMPTALSSAELQGLDASVKRQSFFSARTLLMDLLDGYKADVESIVNPITEQREDRVTSENPAGNVTTGVNQATARLNAKQLLQKLGYQPEPGEEGTLKDLSSNGRINLVLSTNVELAQGAGKFIQGNDPSVLEAFPAQELYRLEDKNKERDWEERWSAAADESGDEDAARILEDTGRMVARKDSPIWDSLGDGAGGYDDSLGNPYPPFAFNSGMWVKDVDYDDASDLGLVDLDTKVEPKEIDFGNIFGVEDN